VTKPARLLNVSIPNAPMPTVAATRRRDLRVLIALVALVWTVAVVSAAQPQGEHAPPVAAAEQVGKEAAAEHAAGGEGGHESPWALPARIFNFALLAGGLVYLLRSPLIGHLTQMGIQVRSELTSAASLRREAAAQLAAVEARMQALPGEIDALKRRGAEEIATEEARISSLAEAERQRLLEQAKREIGMQLRVAERELKQRAGELAVEVATARVKRTITAADHERLVNQYVEQVRH
jgi:F0F1-type ATP synthase membrane subunit b/b'